MSQILADGVTLPSNVIDIALHPRHTIHQDRKLVEGVLKGDPAFIRRFNSRVEPYLQAHASDPIWDDFSAGYRHGADTLARDNFEILRRWKFDARSLSQQIQQVLSKALRDELLARRNSARSSPMLSEAVVASQSDLSDTHYWILRKLIVDGVHQKKLLKSLTECPEAQIKSQASVGATYSRALRRLHKVCPPQHKLAVGEFLRTRQRSGRN